MQKHSVYLIEAFLDFARHKNMVKAATSLGISQPALSRQLSEFEAQVGQKLFQYKGRQKVLTALGEELFTRLSREWKDYSELINETCAQFADKPTVAIKIYGPYEWLGRMAQVLKFPHALDFIPTLSEEVVFKLERNEISLGLTRILPSDNSALVCKKCFENEFYITVPRNWKIKSDSFNKKLLQELSNYPRFAFRHDSESATFVKLKEKINLEPKRILPNWQVLLNLVNEGKGWAIAPSDVILSLNSVDKIELIKVPSSVIEPSKFYLMYKPELIKISWFKELVQEILS